MNVIEVGLLLQQLDAQARNDVSGLFLAADAMSSAEFQQWMADAYPDTILPYSAAAADIAAEWYDSLLPTSSYQALNGTLPDVQRLTKSVYWALSQDSSADKLSGSAQRAVYDGARNTIVENSDAEKGARWARHASANACAFCRLLATRGPVYHSKDSALACHDHCHCMAVPIRPGQSYDAPAYVKDWETQYTDARKQVGGNVRDIISQMRRSDAS